MPTRIGKGLFIKGRLIGEREEIIVDGLIDGELDLEGGQLFVEETGAVEGSIATAKLIVAGECRGKIKVTSSIHVLASGKVFGEITTPVLSVKEGAIILGTLSVGL